MREESAPDATTVESWVDRDVLYEQVILEGDEHDQPDDLPVRRDDVDLAVPHARGVVVVHRSRPAPDPLDVGLVRPLDNRPQTVEVTPLGKIDQTLNLRSVWRRGTRTEL